VNTELLEITDRSQLQKLVEAAHEIWNEYYPYLLKPEKIRYMLEKFQTVEAMERNIAEEGCRYFLLMQGENVLGYLAIKPEGDKLFLSKAYLKKSVRGQGHFSRMMEFMENAAREQGLKSIYLTVNKGNADSIAVYCKKGFHVAREQVIDIGGGFVMDDYVMEKFL